MISTGTSLKAYDAIQAGVAKSQELGLTKTLDVAVNITIALQDAGYRIVKARRPKAGK